MSSIVSKPYAKALFLAAEEAGVLTRIQNEFSTFLTWLKEEPKAALLLTLPQVKTEDKRKVLHAFLDGVHPYLLHLVDVMLDHGREKLFEKVYEAYLYMADAREGRVEAEIQAARALSEEEEKKLVQLFQEKTGKKLRYRTKVIPGLIGGVVIRVGDTLYDGSIRTRLRKVEKQMMETRV